MKHLLIIGARGWGREVYHAAKKTREYLEGSYDIKGFLDDDATVLDGIDGSFPSIISSVEAYVPVEDDVFFVALGESQWRRHYSEIIKTKGGHFITIVSPDAVVLPTAVIGEGTIISRWSIVSDNVSIGDHSVVHSFCDIGHDSRIGDFCTVESFCFIGGKSQVGNSSTLHVRSTLIRNKKVGKNCAVGSGSVVMRNVPDDTHVFGNPAQKIEL